MLMTQCMIYFDVREYICVIAEGGFFLICPSHVRARFSYRIYRYFAQWPNLQGFRATSRWNVSKRATNPYESHMRTSFSRPSHRVVVDAATAPSSSLSSFTSHPKSAIIIGTVACSQTPRPQLVDNRLVRVQIINVPTLLSSLQPPTFHTSPSPNTYRLFFLPRRRALLSFRLPQAFPPRLGNLLLSHSSRIYMLNTTSPYTYLHLTYRIQKKTRKIQHPWEWNETAENIIFAVPPSYSDL